MEQERKRVKRVSSEKRQKTEKYFSQIFCVTTNAMKNSPICQTQQQKNRLRNAVNIMRLREKRTAPSPTEFCSLFCCFVFVMVCGFGCDIDDIDVRELLPKMPTHGKDTTTCQALQFPFLSILLSSRDTNWYDRHWTAQGLSISTNENDTKQKSVRRVSFAER